MGLYPATIRIIISHNNHDIYLEKKEKHHDQELDSVNRHHYYPCRGWCLCSAWPCWWPSYEEKPNPLRKDGDLFSKSQGSSTRSGDTEAKSEKSNISTRSEGGSKAEKSTGSTRSNGGSTTKSKTGAHRLFTKAQKNSNGSTRSGGGDAKAQKDESGSTRSNGDAKANKTTASNRSTNSAKTEKSETVRL